MRICNRCGNADPPCWKHTANKHWTDYTRPEELVMYDKELEAKIPPHHVVTIGAYRYKRSRTGYITRIAVIDTKDPSNPTCMAEPPQEKAKFHYHYETHKLERFMEKPIKR